MAAVNWGMYSGLVVAELLALPPASDGLAVGALACTMSAAGVAAGAAALSAAPSAAAGDATSSFARGVRTVSATDAPPSTFGEAILGRGIRGDEAGREKKLKRQWRRL